MTMQTKKKLNAIDLYSGIGGWSIGLLMNNINIVQSFEWWEPAVKTANLNLGKNDEPIDIRTYDFKKIPQGIDIVVGSPPCTQFSYSNRGGSGDIEDGIIDLYKFFECISIVKPKFWAMENVPRVKNVLEEQIKKGGQLYKFRKIISSGFVEVLDFSEFGLPQKRKRCIASNIDLELLNSYKVKIKTKTLGEVISSFRSPIIQDMNYKNTFKKIEINDREAEEPLNINEERMNREMKVNHPVYNNMSFPENLDKPSRTITATCTRVSRESLVIKAKGGYRRLSVRERGCLQGFPLSYQFHGGSHAQKLKMIGNAIPPVMTFYLASAMKQKSVKQLSTLDKLSYPIKNKCLSLKTKPDSASARFRSNRAFRYALPFLRFKSGTRFELSNKSSDFRFNFFYGDSKNIKSIDLNKQLSKRCENFIRNYEEELSNEIVNKILKPAYKLHSNKLQLAWVEQTNNHNPFDYLDRINLLSEEVHDKLLDIDEEAIQAFVLKIFKLNCSTKIKEHARRITIGFLVLSLLNQSADN